MVEQAPTLCVGTRISHGGDSTDWDDDYNIKSYEYVILDYYSLEQDIQNGSFDDIPNQPSEEDILKFIAAGNRLFVLLPKSSRIEYGNRFIRPESVIPGNMTLQEESGKYVHLENVADEWEWYFKNQFEWENRLGIENRPFEINGADFITETTPIIQNTSGEYLAWSVKYERLFNNPVPTQGRESKRLSGTVTFLPVINDWLPNELVASILEKFAGINISPTYEDSPDWTKDWSLPNEGNTRDRVEELKEEIDDMQELLDRLQQELEEFRRYKTLLWGNEGALERLVPEVLEEMGFDVEGEEPHGRDGMLYFDDQCYVLEITGTTNDIPDRKYTQLLGWVADAEAESDDLETEFTGLLVVNPRRKEDPESRNPNEYLPPHLRRRMIQKGFKLLLTPTLYEMLSLYREGEIKTEDILERLQSDKLVIDI